MTRSRGAALVAVLFAIMLLGSLVGIIFFPSLTELRGGRESMRLVQASAAVSTGVDEVIAHWPGHGYDQLRAGDSAAVFSPLFSSRTGWYRGSVRRMSPRFYVVRIEGFSRDSIARQSVAAVVTRDPLPLALDRAVTAQGPPVVQPGGRISDIDSVPPTTICPDVGPGSARSFEGPDARWDSVISRLSLVESRTLVSGLGSPPAGPPVVYHGSGLIELVGFRGEGALVVNGSLILGPGTDFRGVVVVRGPLTIRGGNLLGAAVVLGEAASTTVEAGAIVFANCYAAIGYDALSVVIPLRDRSEFWAF